MKSILGMGMGIMALMGMAAGSLELEAQEALKDAIKNLGEKGSYSWTATSTREGSSRRPPSGPVEGKAGKDGVVYLKIKQGETVVEGVVKGEKAAVKVENEWKPAGGITREAGFDWRNPAFRMARSLTGIQSPVKEAGSLLEAVERVADEGDGLYSGALSEAGAQKALSGNRRRGGNSPGVSGAEGSVKFWVKDGVLVKYESTLKGKVTFGQREIQVNRTTTVEIKGIGSTEIEIPEEARKHLE